MVLQDPCGACFLTWTKVVVEKRKVNGFGIGHGIKSMGIVSGLDTVLRGKQEKVCLKPLER